MKAIIANIVLRNFIEIVIQYSAACTVITQAQVTYTAHSTSYTVSTYKF